MEQLGQQVKKRKLVDIGTKTFISVFAMLFALIVLSIVLTYLLPKGEFGTTINESGEMVSDYGTYIKLENQSGINIFKGIFSPFLILGTGDGLRLIMLSLFLVVISGAFQAMNDCLGIKVFVNRIIARFRHRKFL